MSEWNVIHDNFYTKTACSQRQMHTDMHTSLRVVMGKQDMYIYELSGTPDWDNYFKALPRTNN